ncbi:MAG: pyridoxamine 5'-phosphate oxidase family protein [Clostridia bacterium]|nr:pyridoxamine 5'-phosphate oxidase family protein [Clostridia bacterium]
MNEACAAILAKRFGTDSLMALATVDETGNPWVRTIDAIFVGDSFYTITHGSSHKMEHLRRDPRAAISGDWFSGHALCASLGHVAAEENREIADRLRAAFAAWYDNGHTDESDPQTIILRIRLTDGILYDHGTRYVF